MVKWKQIIISDHIHIIFRVEHEFDALIRIYNKYLEIADAIFYDFLMAYCAMNNLSLKPINPGNVFLKFCIWAQRELTQQDKIYLSAVGLHYLKSEDIKKKERP